MPDLKSSLENAAIALDNFISEHVLHPLGEIFMHSPPEQRGPLGELYRTIDNVQEAKLRLGGMDDSFKHPTEQDIQTVVNGVTALRTAITAVQAAGHIHLTAVNQIGLEKLIIKVFQEAQLASKDVQLPEGYTIDMGGH